MTPASFWVSQTQRAIYEAYQFLNLQVTSVGYPPLRTRKVSRVQEANGHRLIIAHPWDLHATI
eukprot:37089-Prorocentrum_lima.AAC.1